MYYVFSCQKKLTFFHGFEIATIKQSIIEKKFSNEVGLKMA